MAAFVLVRSESARDGLQPFDAGRHMRQVAELVAGVFADELDARGRNALREMQLAGRLGPWLGSALSMALLGELVFGYVWVEDGRVVGNVTLQGIDQSGSRWRISNVAVAPECRGRGIARSLMEATLREIGQRRGDWAILQVRADNPQARGLYSSLGFSDVCRDGVWRLPAPPLHPADPGVPLEPLRSLTGYEWLELARAARSPLAHWVEPVVAAEYRLGLARLAGEALGRWSGLYRVERWAAWHQDRLVGAVETRANEASGFYALRFAVRPVARGTLEHALVARGLRSLAGGGSCPVVVEHDGEHVEGVAALQAAGFKIQRDLITMRRAIKPGDGRT